MNARPLRTLVAFLWLITTGLSPLLAQVPTAEPIEAELVDSEPSRASATPSPASAETPQAPATTRLQTQAHGIDLQLVLFDPARVRLDLLDQPDGPGSRWADAAAVAAAEPALLAVINGGFFDPQGRPLGLRRDDGQTLNAPVPPGTLYHGVVSDDGSTIRLETVAEWNARPSRDLEALQTGPRLVWDGAATAGLNDTRRAWRSFVALTEDGRFVLGQSSLCTLAELAQALSAISDLPLRRALNLDGGRSCDLWIAGSITGGEPFQRRAPFANPVRDFLGLQPREPAIP